MTSRPGAGWDFSLARHPYFGHERDPGPHDCVYNRRLMAARFDTRSAEDGHRTYRRDVDLLLTGEYVLQFKGPDAALLLDRVFTRDITKLKVGRWCYGLACYDDGGLIVDGIVMRLDGQLYWYVQADCDFYSWVRAHARGLDVELSDPDVFVSQVQGPNSLKFLEAASQHGLPVNASDARGHSGSPFLTQRTTGT